MINTHILSIALNSTHSPRSMSVMFFIILGCFFLTVGTLGLLRLPDVYNRLHATSKSTTLGAASIFFSGFLHYGFQGMGLTSLVGVLFLFLTAPTGSHMISRAAQKMGVEFFGDIAWPIHSDSQTPLNEDAILDETEI
tara:strand:- start:23 stop:436 length:414 start_codon:yes stop_codon:yes gene_type:complete